MQKWKLSRKTKHKHFMPTECSFYPNTAGQHPGGRRNRWIVIKNWTTEHQDLIQVLGIYPTWVKNSPGNSEIFPTWMWNENVEINVCSSTGGWGGWLGGWLATPDCLGPHRAKYRQREKWRRESWGCSCLETSQMFSVKKYFVKMKIKKYFQQIECSPLASLTDYTKVEAGLEK